MLEAIIFDIHGTLVDSVDAKAWQVAFKKFGKKFPSERYAVRSAKAPINCCPCFFSKDELDHFGPVYHPADLLARYDSSPRR
jgi:beta-phosphoglucomutase-like phosphatase (HAD superfamily)